MMRNNYRNIDHEDSSKIIVLSVNNSTNLATKIEFNSVPEFDFVNISGSELKCFKYDSNIITVTLFNLTSTNGTKSETSYTLNLSNTTPNPLPVSINTLYTDSILVDLNRILISLNIHNLLSYFLALHHSH